MKNHDEKKIALEEAAVSIFLNLYNLNRSDHLEILEKRERPDYLLKDINHNPLGLEVTHLFYDSDEARTMLNRSEPKRDKPQNSEGHIEVINKLLKQKEKKLEQYDTDYPISLLVRNASAIFGMSSFLTYKHMIYKPKNYTHVWLVSKDGNYNDWLFKDILTL